MDMDIEKRLAIIDLPLKQRREALRGLTCEICKAKPAKNILRKSLSLCCMDRAIRCPGIPSPNDICYGCGSPAMTKTELGFVCGTHHWDGCLKVYEERMSRKAATFHILQYLWK